VRRGGPDLWIDRCPGCDQERYFTPFTADQQRCSSCPPFLAEQEDDLTGPLPPLPEECYPPLSVVLDVEFEDLAAPGGPGDGQPDAEIAGSSGGASDGC
jgi:hypothetical protein